MSHGEDSAKIEPSVTPQKVDQPQLNGLEPRLPPSEHDSISSDHCKTTGEKRKAQDRDDSELGLDCPIAKSPKMDRPQSDESKVNGVPNDWPSELSDAGNYWNRDPLSPLRTDDRQEWPGFREIETDDDAFESMLKTLGTRGIVVRQVVGLDMELLSILPQPIVGFLLCFRHRSDDETNQVDSCPDNIWFANQTHRWLCGSNSLINMILNIPDVYLGEHLNSFKAFTKDFTPAQRGEAVGNYDFLRQVHNSCLRKMEILLGDVALMEEYNNRKPSRKPVTSDEKPESASKSTPKGKGKSKAKTKSKTIVEEDAVDDDAAYHYAAYLPIEGHIWKLDGLDRQPSKLSPCDDDDWLHKTAKILFDRISEVDDESGYSILALCREDDQLESVRKRLIGNISKAITLTASLPSIVDHSVEQECLADDVIKGPRSELEITQYDLDNHTETFDDVLDVVSAKDDDRLRELHSGVIAEQEHLLQQIRKQQQAREQEEERLKLTRYDYEPLVRTWVEMLACKDGVFRELVESL